MGHPTYATLTPHVPEYISGKDVARIAGVTELTVRRWRDRGTGPRYIKLGRIYRYPTRGVLSWLESCAPDSHSAAHNDD